MIMIIMIMVVIVTVTDIPAVWTRLSGNLNMIIVIIFMIMIMIMIIIYNKNQTFTMTMINMVKMRKPRCFQTLASPDNFPPHQGLACLRSPGNDDYHSFHYDDYHCHQHQIVNIIVSNTNSTNINHYHHPEHRGRKMRRLLPRIGVGKSSTEHFRGQRVL